MLPLFAQSESQKLLVTSQFELGTGCFNLEWGLPLLLAGRAGNADGERTLGRILRHDERPIGLVCSIGLASTLPGL